MIRVYLDQKDYINISKGLLGDNNFEKDVECYKFLLPLVKNGRIRIFYSWAHISETLKYADKLTDVLKMRCEVFDNLTNGHCLLQIQNIILAEIKNYLFTEFKSDGSLVVSPDKYPFGTGSDCIEFDMDFRALRTKMSPSQIKNIKNRVLLRSKKELSKILPNSDTLSKKDIIKLLTYDEKMIKKYFDNILSFKPLFLKYRALAVQDLNINKMPIERSSQFFDIMNDYRDRVILGYDIIEEQDTQSAKQQIKSKLIKKQNELVEQLLQSISDYYKNTISVYISTFLQFHNINQSDALNRLDDFSHICGVQFYKDLLKEYLNRNGAFSKNPRSLDLNDYFDIEHLRNLPYVDYYVTERYFGDIAEKIAGNYNTIVFKNLHSMHKHLMKI